MPSYSFDNNDVKEFFEKNKRFPKIALRASYPNDYSSETPLIDLEEVYELFKQRIIEEVILKDKGSIIV